MTKPAKTSTIVTALRILAKRQPEPGWKPDSVCAQAADRLEELANQPPPVRQIRADDLREALRRAFPPALTSRHLVHALPAIAGSLEQVLAGKPDPSLAGRRAAEFAGDPVAAAAAEPATPEDRTSVRPQGSGVRVIRSTRGLS